jgi:DNA polymerase-1
LPVVCRWSPGLSAWIEAHAAGWIAYAAAADRDFLERVGCTLGGRIDDPMLKLQLVDEHSWDRREDRDDTKHPARGLKAAAQYFLGIPNWETNRLRRAKPASGLRPEWDEIPEDELAAYCADDIAATVALWMYAESQLTAHPELRQVYETISRPTQAVLDQASTVGVPVDAPELRQRLAGVPEQLVTLRGEVQQLTGVEVNLASAPQKAALLYTTLRFPCPRKTDRGNPSVDKYALARLRGRHPVIATLERASELRSTATTYTTWLKHLQNGRLHPRYNVAGMVSGRASSSGPTLQNVPHGEARSLFRAPAGFAILVADYKTLEFGVAAWLYDEATMWATYHNGDAHTITATQLLGRPPIPGTGERLEFGKTPNFALLYQQGPQGFYDYGLDVMGLAWTKKRAAEVHAGWHRLYSGVRPAWGRIAARQHAQMCLVSPSGRTRRWAAITRKAERQGTNFIVQATAAELCHCAAVLTMTQSEIPSLGAELVLSVHDGLMFVVPESRVGTVARILQSVMTDQTKAYFAEQFRCAVPIALKVELSAGPSWGEAQPLELGVEAE